MHDKSKSHNYSRSYDPFKAPANPGFYPLLPPECDGTLKTSASLAISCPTCNCMRSSPSNGLTPGGVTKLIKHFIASLSSESSLHGIFFHRYCFLHHFGIGCCLPSDRRRTAVAATAAAAIRFTHDKATNATDGATDSTTSQNYQ